MKKNFCEALWLENPPKCVSPTDAARSDLLLCILLHSRAGVVLLYRTYWHETPLMNPIYVDMHSSDGLYQGSTRFHQLRKKQVRSCNCVLARLQLNRYRNSKFTAGQKHYALENFVAQIPQDIIDKVKAFEVLQEMKGTP